MCVYVLCVMGWLKKLLVTGVLVACASVAWEWAHSVNLEGWLVYPMILAAILDLAVPCIPIPCTEFYKDKRVIVTGASKGIGKALAIQLSQLGAR